MSRSCFLITTDFLQFDFYAIRFQEMLRCFGDKRILVACTGGQKTTMCGVKLALKFRFLPFSDCGKCFHHQFRSIFSLSVVSVFYFAYSHLSSHKTHTHKLYFITIPFSASFFIYLPANTYEITTIFCFVFLFAVIVSAYAPVATICQPFIGWTAVMQKRHLAPCCPTNELIANLVPATRQATFSARCYSLVK